MSAQRVSQISQVSQNLRTSNDNIGANPGEVPQLPAENVRSSAPQVDLPEPVEFQGKDEPDPRAPALLVFSTGARKLTASARAEKLSRLRERQDHRVHDLRARREERARARAVLSYLDGRRPASEVDPALLALSPRTPGAEVGIGEEAGTGEGNVGMERDEREEVAEPGEPEGPTLRLDSLDWEE